MKTRAALAVEAGKPLEIVDVNLDGPKDGEVLVEIMATGVCHTDEFTLSGADPEGIFPAILGHEGAGVVREVGPNVKSLKVGDHVIPLYTPECRQCDYCLHPKTNLCQAIRETQGQGLMPDGTSRFTTEEGDKIFHYMGTSTFSNFTIMPEIAAAKIREDAPFDKYKVDFPQYDPISRIGPIFENSLAQFNKASPSCLGIKPFTFSKPLRFICKFYSFQE